MSYIKKNTISGVIFVTGDRHHTELILHNDTTFYPLYDFTSSALTSGLNSMRQRDGSPAREFSNPLRVPGTLVNDKHNFGMLRFSGKRQERKVILETYDITGAVRWSKEIRANDLKVK